MRRKVDSPNLQYFSFILTGFTCPYLWYYSSMTSYPRLNQIVQSLRAALRLDLGALIISGTVLFVCSLLYMWSFEMDREPGGYFNGPMTYNEIVPPALLLISGILFLLLIIICSLYVRIQPFEPSTIQRRSKQTLITTFIFSLFTILLSPTSQYIGHKSWDFRDTTLIGASPIPIKTIEDFVTIVVYVLIVTGLVTLVYSIGLRLGLTYADSLNGKLRKVKRSRYYHVIGAMGMLSGAVLFVCLLNSKSFFGLYPLLIVLSPLIDHFSVFSWIPLYSLWSTEIVISIPFLLTGTAIGLLIAQWTDQGRRNLQNHLT